MKAGRNVWIGRGGKRIKSEDDPGDGWYPCYPESRVTGDNYTPYDGDTPWVRAANAAMRQAAQSNFQRKSGW